MDRIRLALKNNGIPPHWRLDQNFDQHQENGREPIFSGATILSWVIGKAAKMSKGSQNQIVF